MFRVVYVPILIMMCGCTAESSKCTIEDILKLTDSGYSKKEIDDICNTNIVHDEKSTPSIAAGSMPDNHISSQHEPEIKGEEKIINKIENQDVSVIVEKIALGDTNKDDIPFENEVKPAADASVSPFVQSAYESNIQSDSQSATVDSFPGIWVYENNGSKGYLKIVYVSPDVYRFYSGWKEKGEYHWRQPEITRKDGTFDYTSGLYLKHSDGLLSVEFVSGNFYATHGMNFTYKITLRLKSSDTLIYTVYTELAVGVDVKEAYKIRDLEGEAIDLHEQASKLVKILINETTSYTQALKIYQQSRDRIDRITTDYASSTIAMGLVSGQTNISNMTLNDYYALESTLQSLAKAEQSPLACALLVAETIEDAYFRAEALVNIAAKYAVIGQQDIVEQVLSHVIMTLHPIGNTYSESSLLSRIAGMYSDSGKLADALQIANLIGNANIQAGMLSILSVKYTEIGQQDKADQMLSTFLERVGAIEDAADKIKALSDAAVKFAKAGLQEGASNIFSQALKIARTIDDADYKATELEKIAGAYVEIGLLTNALEIARTIELAENLVPVLLAIADKYIEAKNNNDVLDILSMAFDAAKSLRIISFKDRFFSEIVAKYVEVHQFSKAVELAYIIDNIDVKDRAITNIADKYAKSGHYVKAIKATDLIRSVIGKAGALTKIAKYYVKDGKQDEAVQVLTSMDIIGGAIDIDGWRLEEIALLYAEISANYAKLGQAKKASHVFSISLDVAKTIKFEGTRSSALTEIAGVFIDSAQWHEASAYKFALSLALSTAEKIHGADTRAIILSEIADKYVESGQLEKGIEILGLALKAARTFDNPYEVHHPLSYIAESYVKMGKHNEALEIAKLIMTNYAPNNAFAKISRIYADKEQFSHAFEMIKYIDDASKKAGELTDISDKYADAGYQHDERIMLSLHNIAQDTMSMRLPWN